MDSLSRRAHRASPLTVVIIMVLLAVQIGWAGVAGAALMLLCLPLQMYMAKEQGVARREMIRHSDERVKKVNEVLQGIRVIKYNSWEKPVWNQRPSSPISLMSMPCRVRVCVGTII
jgi:hypothetical protein